MGALWKTYARLFWAHNLDTHEDQCQREEECLKICLKRILLLIFFEKIPFLTFQFQPFQLEFHWEEGTLCVEVGLKLENKVRPKS